MWDNGQMLTMNIYPKMKYIRNHYNNQMIDKFKSTKSSSIPTLWTLINCMESQLQAMQLLLQSFDNEYASHGKQ
jgi:hypothetical protein